MYGDYVTREQHEKLTREVIRMANAMTEIVHELQDQSAQIAKLNKAVLTQAMYIDQLEQKLSKQTDEKLAKFTSSWT